MPISPDQLPERLRKALAKAGVEVTESDPSPECNVIARGFCNQKCANLAMLAGQAVDGSAPDARLAKAAANLVQSWEGYGCSVLRFKKVT